ncbi:MAG: hypothetical protein BWY11_00053 [Firmicutes bacterium ADurb.Bin182]|jgi:hypothetical protein|nr:MAG: hypothetical protein BWY11_00053 [Firmicutes bacterium ADurb.Bin182]
MKPQQECFDAYLFSETIILVPKGHPYTPEFDIVAKEVGGEKVRVWRRKVEDECKHYIKTGIGGSYETAGIVDTPLESKLIPLFEDTELIEEPDSMCLERHMEIAGKKFAIKSVFPKAAASLPTDKLLTLIDKEQEK